MTVTEQNFVINGDSITILKAGDYFIGNTAKPTKKEFEKFVRSLPFQFPNLIIKQAYWESGHLKSDLVLNNNNLFGMKNPKRITFAVVCEQEYAYYDDWRDSVLDRYLWDCLYVRGYNRECDYISVLDAIYSETENYIDTIKNVKL